MKRLHSLLQLGAAKPSVESNTDEAAVVNQPTEGQPTVQPTSEVLTDEQKAEQARQKADEATPADGSVPSTEVPGVSQESDGGAGAGVTAPVATETNPTPNNTVDTGDGSQPATAADDLSGEAKAARADLGATVTASQESQETGVVAPVATETKPELNNKVDTGDGSQPATPSDQPGDEGKRADEGAAKTAPTELAPELEQVVVKAPQTTSVAADANNPDKEGKTGEGKADPVNTTSTQDSAIEGGATPKETTSTEKSAVSQENLSPEDIAKVATVAAAVGAATAGAPAEAAVVEAAAPAAPAAAPVVEEAAVVAEAPVVNDGAAVDGSDGAGALAPGEVPADAAGNAIDAAAQAAVDTVAQSPTGDTPPGPNAGDAAATPAEAAQVAADLIAANPDNAAEIAQAIDTVADAGVAAAGGEVKPEETAPVVEETQPADQDDGAADELNDSTDERDEDDDKLDDLEDVGEDLEASQESLVSARELLTGLESLVETALQNGGLSDDAAQILQTVTDHVTNEAGLDETDLGLESLAYCDRKNATNYALGRLQATIESIDGELQISTEGFFDIFRSFNSKMKDWVVSSRRNIAAAKAAIKDKNKSASVTLPGEEGDFSKIASLSASTLTDVLDTYGKKAYVAAKVLTDMGKELADGDNHYETVAGKISGIEVGFPASFNQNTPSGMGDGKASGPLLGDFALALSLDGRDSESDIVKVREKHEGEVTGAQAIAALDEATKVVDAVSNFIGQFDGMKKTANNSGDRHVTGATYLASVMGPWALLSADYRRAVYRQFTNSKDPQNLKAGEVIAGFELVKDAATASRKYVAALIAISTKVAG